MKKIVIIVVVLLGAIMLGSCDKDEVNVAQLEGTKWTLVKIEYLFNGETVYSTTDTKEAEVSHELRFENGNLTFDYYRDGEMAVAPYSLVENVLIVSDFYRTLTRCGNSDKYKVVKLSNKEFVIESYVYGTVNYEDDAPSYTTYKGVQIQMDDTYYSPLFYKDSYDFDFESYVGIQVLPLPSGDFYDVCRLYYKVVK